MYSLLMITFNSVTLFVFLKFYFKCAIDDTEHNPNVKNRENKEILHIGQY